MTGRLPTLSDVARHAGVSYATADRVVNGRGGVAEKSASRVRAAIAALGYVRNVAAANLSQRRRYRFVVLIPGGANAFFAGMRAILARSEPTLATEQTEMVVRTVDAFDAGALTRALDDCGSDAPDGVALVGIDDPNVSAAAMRLRERGIAVISLVSDIQSDARDAYIGIDNAVAGRTAARLIALATGETARILPIVGALAARDHRDRLDGFRAVLTSAMPSATILPEIEGHDRHDRVEASLRDALGQEPGIDAIYSIGAGNAGLIRVLEDRAARPVTILHELVPNTRAALERGLIDIVIDQRPDTEIEQALALLRAIADRKAPEPPPPVLPAIYVKDNLPPPVADIPKEMPNHE